MQNPAKSSGYCSSHVLIIIVFHIIEPQGCIIETQALGPKAAGGAWFCIQVFILAHQYSHDLQAMTLYTKFNLPSIQCI